jgi:transcriptional regulator with XRE-family HTH domain
VTRSTRIRQPASFGVELGRLLVDRHVTFRELAMRTGLAPATLNRYVSGKRRPDDATLELIAAALEVAPQRFAEWRRRRVLERIGESAQLVDALWQRITG